MVRELDSSMVVCVLRRTFSGGLLQSGRSGVREGHYGVGSSSSSQAQEAEGAKGTSGPPTRERTASLRAVSQTMLPEIKMVVGEWYTDELGDRARIIYNTKTMDVEPPCDLAHAVTPA